MTDPAEAIRPTAAALVCAVADQDAHDIRDILTKLDTSELYALAVVLAANVSDDAPLHNYLATLTPEQQVDVAITRAAELFNTTGDHILAGDRHRHTTDARAVAMAACRLVGLSSPFIGTAFQRDHSTVLHAAGRVGEIPRLRHAAVAIADEIGDRGFLNDELDEGNVA